MSKSGKHLITALKEAIKNGLITLPASPGAGKLKKKLKSSKQPKTIRDLINKHLVK